MENRFLIALSCLALSCCDPSYQVFIKNDLEGDIYVRTVPPIEAALGREFPKHLKVLDADSSIIYRFRPGEQVLINAHIGFRPLPEYFPYNYVQVSSRLDTVTLNSGPDILAELTRIRSNRKYYFLFSNVFKNQRN